MKLNWLINVIPEEVSYVDKPAIDKRFYALKMEVKGALPFKATEPLPEATLWDAGVQVKKAETKDLKTMCAWYDSKEPDKKGSYKLPHHRCGDGYPVVWNGVKAAMGALMGARGGVDIPSEHRKAVYNHLVKHYKQWDKEPPEFKMIEESKPLLSKLGNTIMEKLGLVDTKIGRVLSKSNENRLLEATKSITKACEIIESVLSTIKKNVKEEEMNEKEINELIAKAIDEKFGALEKSIEAKLEKLLFEEEEKVKEPKTEPVDETEEEKKKREEEEEKEEVSEEKTSKDSLLTKLTAVIEEKSEGIASRIDVIEKELKIKPESDKKEVNKKELEEKKDDKEADFTGVFGLKKI